MMHIDTGYALETCNYNWSNFKMGMTDQHNIAQELCKKKSLAIILIYNTQNNVFKDQGQSWNNKHCYLHYHWGR